MNNSCSEIESARVLWYNYVEYLLKFTIALSSTKTCIVNRGEVTNSCPAGLPTLGMRTLIIIHKYGTRFM